MPENLILSQGLNAGSILCSINAVKNATGYLFEATKDPVTENSNWISIPCTRTKCEFEGLEQGEQYWFRVAAVGSNGQVIYSNIVFQFVLQRTLDIAA